jgi:GT2 family glycosyltransferase
MKSPNAAVVILNYNGHYYLEKFLPDIVAHSLPYPVIVADNASTDQSVAFMKAHHPEIRLIQNTENFGYAEGYNAALSQIDAEYYILLNSDVEVTDNWIAPVLDLMESNHQIAACQPKILDYNQRHYFEYAGAAGGFIDKYGYPFCRGRIFNHLEEDKQQYNDAREVFWATGACLFVRSAAFQKAGGFDGDYFAHMEEIDLCWRLKNIGYKIMVEPRSIIYHIGGGTLNKLSRRKTYLNFRNNLITLTKNHPSSGLLFKILYRLILDGVAGLKFLSDGEPKHCLAVLHAHFSYYKRLVKTLQKRGKFSQTEGFAYNLGTMYEGNIVLEHFIGKKKKFSELTKIFRS